MIYVEVAVHDGKQRKSILSGALNDSAVMDRPLMLSTAEELMSAVLDSVQYGLGKQAREELARRAEHEKEVRGG